MGREPRIQESDLHYHVIARCNNRAFHFETNEDFEIYLGKRKKRKGHFWMTRYKNIPVETDGHALTLMRYINRNAVRAGIASKPGDWKYSGYRFYAEGEPNDLLDPHPTYLGLALKEQTRRTYYRRYVCQILPDEDARNPYLSESRFIGSRTFGRRLGLKTSF